METLCRTESASNTHPHTPTIELVVPSIPRQESLESSDHFVTYHPQSGKT